MNIDTLKIFCDLIELKSFSLAARQNGITQSAASQHVKNLEKHLNITLIDRVQRPWKPTPEGVLFQEKLKNIIDQYFNLEAKIRGMRTQISQSVRISCIYSVGMAHMKRHVDIFKNTHPGCAIHLEYHHPERIYKDISQGIIDLGIVSFHIPTKNITPLPLFNEPMVLVFAPGHDYGLSSGIFLSRLTGQDFIAFDKGLSIRKEIDKFLRRHDVHPNNVLEFDNIEAIKRAVESGAGVAILPRPCLTNELNAGSLACVPFFPGDFTRPLSIIHLRGHEFHKAGQLFIEYLLKAYG